METLQRFWEEIKGIYSRLEPRNRIFIIFGSFITVIMLYALVWFFSQANYTVLYSNLAPAESGQIVEKLKENNVSYQLKGGGATILVPEGDVYDLRLELASQGLPHSGSIGYEIFDKNNIGTTDFVQKINYQRALEGELSRTISTINEVAAARVHLVIPEKSLFVEDQKKTTASVTLRLKPGNTLTATQTRGITNLMAASVEGLQPENITIVDTNGNLLAQPSDSDSKMALSANQLELKTQVETYYTKKLTQLLEKVVGKDKAAVQVTADLNFDQVERTIERYDPDNVVVISEERNSQVANDSNSPQKSEDVVTNYEASKTVETIVQDMGNIKRISVAVMVDGKYQVPAGMGSDAEPQYVPLSETEMSQLEEIVRSAVGYSEERNDEVRIVNMPFQRTNLIDETELLDKLEKRIFWEKTIKRIIYLVLALAVLFGIWKILRSFKTMIYPYRSDVLSLGGDKRSGNFEISPDLKNNARLQHTIANLTKEKPSDAANLLKAWLIEEENE